MSGVTEIFDQSEWRKVSKGNTQKQKDVNLDVVILMLQRRLLQSIIFIFHGTHVSPWQEG